MQDNHIPHENQGIIPSCAPGNGQIVCYHDFQVAEDGRGVEYVERCGEFEVQHDTTLVRYTARGVAVMTINPETGKTSKPVTVSPATIIPVAIVQPVDDRKASPWVILEGRDATSGKIIREMVRYAALGSPSTFQKELASLQEAGFPIREKFAGGKNLASALHVTVAELCREGKLPTIYAAIKNGWMRKRSGERIDGVDVSRPVHIMPGSPGYAGVDEPIHAKAGSEEVQRAVLAEMAENSPGFINLLGLAASGFFHDWISVETKIIHWWGETSQGKTLSLLAAASMIGPTNGTFLVNSWTSSEVGIQAVLNQVNHAFLVLDESHALTSKYQARKDIVLQMLMSYGNDQMATKGTQHGTARERKNWNTTILSSGNDNLTHVGIGTAQEKALKARVLEIDITNRPLFGWQDLKKAQRCGEVLARNYGHIYPLIVDAIVENSERYYQIYGDFYKPIIDAVEKLDSSANYIGRKAQGWALGRVGLEIIHDVLGFDITDAVELLTEIAMEDLEIVQEETEDSLLSTVSEIRAFVGANLGQTKVKGFWYCPGVDVQAPEIQAIRAKEMSQGVREVGIIVDQKTIMGEDELITGTVWVSAKAVFRGQTDIKELAQRALHCGLLERQGRHMTHKHASLGRAFRFDLSKAIEAEQEAMRKDVLAQEAALAASQAAIPEEAPY